MKNYVTSARNALEARRAVTSGWSRLEREIAGYATVTQREEATSEPHADADTAEMRHFLAAQTSQTV